MLPLKELHYFDRSTRYPTPNTLCRTKLYSRLAYRLWLRKCARGVSDSFNARSVTRVRWWSRYLFSNYTDDWYRSLFEFESGLTGDVTPGYSVLDETDIKRMYETVPQAKIIFLIRNPIDRAWSMLRFEQRYGLELDVADFQRFQQRVDSPDQTLRSDYIRTIDLYSKYFDKENILIGFYDAVGRDPHGLLRELYAHIGVRDIDFSHDVGTRVHGSRKVDCPSAFREYLAKKYRPMIEELDKRYGSYASEWLSGLESASSDGPKCESTPSSVARLS